MRRGIEDGAVGDYPPLSEGVGEEVPLLLRIKGTLQSDKMNCIVGFVNSFLTVPLHCCTCLAAMCPATKARSN